jgi:hypothetical protein
LAACWRTRFITKFIYQIESARCSLFNLENDPKELTNLAQREPNRCDFYRTRILNWAAAQKNLILKGG